MILQGLSGAQATAQGQAGNDAKSLGGDLNRFLTLLVTQLQNQDPLDPLDTNEFTAQLVQFAGVEQQINQNAHLESLIEVSKASGVAAMVNLIGKRIEADGTMLPLAGGEAEASYTLAEPAAETTLTLTDADGRVVLTTAGETNAGRHGFVWDGRDGDGKPLADGAYALAVTARRADGSDIAVVTHIAGIVSGAASGEDGLLLNLGPVEVPMARVISITDPAEAAQTRP
jgi:flagellar basal-body rod modification protein FlgD